MELNGKPRPGAPGNAPGPLLQVVVEGNPAQLCRRTVYGTVDGWVLFQMVLTTIGQESVADFLHRVADEFAAKESGIVRP